MLANTVVLYGTGIVSCFHFSLRLSLTFSSHQVQIQLQLSSNHSSNVVEHHSFWGLSVIPLILSCFLLRASVWLLEPHYGIYLKSLLLFEPYLSTFQVPCVLFQRIQE